MLIFSLFPWNFSDGWHFTWCYTCWQKPVVSILKQFYTIIFGVTLQSASSDNTVGDWLNGNKRSHANCPKQGKSLWSSCCRAPEISSSSTSSIIDCHAGNVIECWIIISVLTLVTCWRLFCCVIRHFRVTITSTYYQFVTFIFVRDQETESESVKQDLQVTWR